MGVNLSAKHIYDRGNESPCPGRPLFLRRVHIIAVGKAAPSSVVLVCMPAALLPRTR